MFLIDSWMISGIRWTLETVVTAAEAEMNDDTVPRQQLLEAEMRRELGEIDEAEFRRIESDLLARIREIRERRDGGAGPLTVGERMPLESAAGERFNVDASLAGDFHEDPAASISTPPADVSRGTAHRRQLKSPPGVAAPPRSRSRTRTTARKRRS